MSVINIGQCVTGFTHSNGIPSISMYNGNISSSFSQHCYSSSPPFPAATCSPFPPVLVLPLNPASESQEHCKLPGGSWHSPDKSRFWCILRLKWYRDGVGATPFYISSIIQMSLVPISKTMQVAKRCSNKML